MTNHAELELLKTNTDLLKQIQGLNLEIYDLKLENRKIRERLDACEARCTKLETDFLAAQNEVLDLRKRLFALEEEVAKLRGGK